MLLTMASHEKLEEKLGAGYLVRVFAGDCDITHDCLSADNRHGWALLLDRDARGFHYPGRVGHTARFLYLGDLQFVITDGDGRRVVGIIDADGRLATSNLAGVAVSVAA